MWIAASAAAWDGGSPEKGARVNAMRSWWHQGDQFDWLTLYLNTRGIRLIWRAMITTVIAAIAVIPVLELISPTLPHYPAARIVAPIVSGFGMMVALSWLVHWPNRGRSLLFSRTGSACIAAACLIQGDARLGLLGCSAFAVLGGYIALFHSAHDMVINFVIALATAAVLAARLIGYYDAVAAGCGFLLVLVSNVAFPVSVQWLVHALGSDLRRSSRDTLTGLLTRRTFYQSTYSLLVRRREGPSYLGVAMIDLDNFKRLNDTYGHSTGDQVLVAVGGALRLASPPTSMIARFGGEEFVIADTFPAGDLHDVAEKLRAAVAAVRYPITASVGIASTALGADFHPAERGLTDDLVRLADTAMYAAKHAGGNQSRCTRVADRDLKGSARLAR
jgi:diguanylate cyclase (GGDEF)-like protein